MTRFHSAVYVKLLTITGSQQYNNRCQKIMSSWCWSGRSSTRWTRDCMITFTSVSSKSVRLSWREMAAEWHREVACRRSCRWDTVAAPATRTPSVHRGSTCTSPRGCRTGCQRTSWLVLSPQISRGGLYTCNSADVAITRVDIHQ